MDLFDIIVCHFISKCKYQEKQELPNPNIFLELLTNYNYNNNK